MSAPEEMTNAWEAAYQRFETREQEMQKFLRRLRKAGAPTWRKEAQVVEIFCGRGTGLHALQHLGFKRLEGVDFSAALLANYSGPAKCVVADCRQLPFPDASRDIVIVQGGLHHLPELPADLEKVVSEVRRVLRPGGRFMVVEPWRTPFLRFVHWVGSFKFARRAWDKLDALETMTELEWVTYDQWLLNPDLVLRCLDGNFVTERKLIGWGKLMWVGRNGVISA
ncbi:MAG: class I SAM-dependent methyltransferase [Verrucomicrobia bacterium]|nr:class I SAM-dependent methyltransferase [Verrucomicrobiota bacterium]NDB76365.1 class I SAM-dependent methyltransferase [Verrucomicrobiota bacterium]